MKSRHGCWSGHCMDLDGQDVVACKLDCSRRSWGLGRRGVRFARSTVVCAASTMGASSIMASGSLVDLVWLQHGLQKRDLGAGGEPAAGKISRSPNHQSRHRAEQPIRLELLAVHISVTGRLSSARLIPFSAGRVVDDDGADGADGRRRRPPRCAFRLGGYRRAR